VVLRICRVIGCDVEHKVIGHKQKENVVGRESALTSEVGILAVLSNGGRVMLPPLPQATAETTMTEERKHAILLAATILWARDRFR
jgi:hypothetical protein